MFKRALGFIALVLVVISCAAATAFDPAKLGTQVDHRETLCQDGRHLYLDVYMGTDGVPRLLFSLNKVPVAVYDSKTDEVLVIATGQKLQLEKAGELYENSWCNLPMSVKGPVA
jgi:hypothetical protein